MNPFVYLLVGQFFEELTNFKFSIEIIKLYFKAPDNAYIFDATHFSLSEFLVEKAVLSLPN